MEVSPSRAPHAEVRHYSTQGSPIPGRSARIRLSSPPKPRRDFHYIFEEDGDGNSVPVITLEVLSNLTKADDYADDKNPGNSDEQITQDTAGVHFLTENSNSEPPVNETCEGKEKDRCKDTSKGRTDFLEYMTRSDGSVICKLCGEILQSRTHWYRHKYKLHVMPPLNPAPLFQCDQCLVYFKSRKGYIGHIASRHSETLADSSPVRTNTQAEAITKETPATPSQPSELKEEADPELVLPKSSVPNYQSSVVKQLSKTTESKKPLRNNKEQPNKVDWEERRSREEKLVADIIDRVRRECEAQGSGGAARRGYTRRTTVMHT